MKVAIVKCIIYSVLFYKYKFQLILQVFSKSLVTWWCMPQSIAYVIQNIKELAPSQALLCRDLTKVIYTNVPPSPSSIIWYWPDGIDVLWLGR